MNYLENIQLKIKINHSLDPSMDLLIKLFDVLFPVFLTIGIGYWYGKKDPKFNTNFINEYRVYTIFNCKEITET